MESHEARERIHRYRRQIALHAYLYYEKNISLIHDVEFEFRVLKLKALQGKFPEESKKEPFLRVLFHKEDWYSTSYHISAYIKKSSSRMAESIRRVANDLGHQKSDSTYLSTRAKAYFDEKL